MAIKGVIFDEQTPTAKQMGAIFKPVIKDAILRGCQISYSGSNVIMTAGEIIACGRPIEFNAQESIAVSGTGYARVILNLDMNQTATSETFEQVYFTSETAASETAFVELTKEDINGSGTMYQLEIARFTVASDSITGLISSLGEVNLVPNRILVGSTEYTLHVGQYSAGAAGQIRFSTT